MKIVIVGAGIAGLAIGWELTKAGADVEIVDRGLAGHGATWASGGMLAPGAELGAEDGALARFAHASRNAWGGFAKELETASQVDIGYREDGAFLVAAHDARANELKTLAVKTGDVWLDGKQLRSREPLLGEGLRGAVFVSGDAQVDNRALGVALTAALQRKGIRVRENCAVHAVALTGERAAGIVTAQGAIEGDAVVLACGAWTNLIAGLPPDIVPQIHPVKGQMAAFVPPSGTALPTALIWGEDIYLIPRRDRLIAGATVEDSGFDISVNHEGREALLNAALRVIPSLSEWTLAEMWAGLRPRTSDDAPVLGQTAMSGLYVAGGQFRNGILFAPLIAEAMRRSVLGQAPRPDIETFDPRRFTR